MCLCTWTEYFGRKITGNEDQENKTPFHSIKLGTFQFLLHATQVANFLSKLNAHAILDT